MEEFGSLGYGLFAYGTLLDAPPPNSVSSFFGQVAAGLDTAAVAGLMALQPQPDRICCRLARKFRFGFWLGGHDGRSGRGGRGNGVLVVEKPRQLTLVLSLGGSSWCRGWHNFGRFLFDFGGWCRGGFRLNRHSLCRCWCGCSACAGHRGNFFVFY